MIIDPLLLKLS